MGIAALFTWLGLGLVLVGLGLILLSVRVERFAWLWFIGFLASLFGAGLSLFMVAGILWGDPSATYWERVLALPALGTLAALGWYTCWLVRIASEQNLLLSASSQYDDFEGVVGWFSIAFTAVTLLVAYNTFAPGPRARLAQEADNLQREEEQRQGQERVKAQIETAASDLAERALRHWSPGTPPLDSQVKESRILVVMAKEPRGSLLYDLRGLGPDDAARDYDSARSLCWIQARSRKVGVYRRLWLSFIPSPFASDDAVVITYRVWIISRNTEQVTAYSEFTGPDPPESRTEFRLPGMLPSGPGAYGIPPDQDVLLWINSLPLAPQTNPPPNIGLQPTAADVIMSRRG